MAEIQAVKSTIEEKPKRTLDEITKDHNVICAEAGWLQFRIQCDSQELQRKYVKISALNEEAAELKKGEKDGSKENN